MICLFKDDPDKFAEDHDAYEAWKIAHPDGYILNLGNRRPMLHRPEGCNHLDGPNQIPPKGVSRTRFEKICADSRAKIETYARDIRGIREIVECSVCFRSDDR